MFGKKKVLKSIDVVMTSNRKEEQKHKIIIGDGQWAERGYGGMDIFDKDGTLAGTFEPEAGYTVMYHFNYEEKQ